MWVLTRQEEAWSSQWSHILKPPGTSGDHNSYGCSARTTSFPFSNDGKNVDASDILLMLCEVLWAGSRYDTLCEQVGLDRNVRRVATEPVVSWLWDSLLDYLTKLLSLLRCLSTNEPLTRRDKHSNSLLNSRRLSLLLKQPVCPNNSFWWHYTEMRRHQWLINYKMFSIRTKNLKES